MKNIFSIRRMIAATISVSIILSLTACAAKTESTTSSETSKATDAPAQTVSATTKDVVTTETSVSNERIPVRISALKGPTGIGLVSLMADQDAGVTQNDYSFTLSGSPDDIVAQLSSGQADIAALPTNLAAVLYQKTNQSILMLAINTLGVLYILEKGDQIQSLSDLSGREIMATGQSAVPEYVLSDLLAKSDLDEPVTITYKAEHSELATLAASGKADIVMLPEPFVTTVLSKNPEYRIALDLTEEWHNAYKGISGELAMGCLVVTKEFAQAHPDALDSFLNEYASSVERVNADPAVAGKLVAQYGIMADASLAEKAIPNCHIVLIKGTGMQPILEPFFSILFAANPKSIGGKVPDPQFYWIS